MRYLHFGRMTVYGITLPGIGWDGEEWIVVQDGRVIATYQDCVSDKLILGVVEKWRAEGEDYSVADPKPIIPREAAEYMVNWGWVLPEDIGRQFDQELVTLADNRWEIYVAKGGCMS